MPFIIWSNRHRKWWGPDNAGYTPKLEAADRYTVEEARDICVGHGLPGANVAVDTQLANQLTNGDPDAIEKTLDIWKRL